jgi:hypothetical protein
LLSGNARPDDFYEEGAQEGRHDAQDNERGDECLVDKAERETG